MTTPDCVREQSVLVTARSSSHIKQALHLFICSENEEPKCAYCYHMVFVRCPCCAPTAYVY